MKSSKVILIIAFVAFYSCDVFSQNNDSINNGYTQFKYLNGIVSSEGNIVDGKPNGYWKTYYENGNLKSEGNRVNFKLEDVWFFYNNEGDTLEKISFRNGKKNGYHFKYTYDTLSNEAGYLSSKELFVKGKKQSKSYYYYDNGSVYQIVNFTNDRRNKLTREFDRSGNLITVITYRKNIIIKKEKINRRDERGFKEGIWRTYFDNDRVRKEENYLNDLLHGYSREYNIRGQLIKTYKYFNGKLISDNTKEEKKAEEKKEYHKNGTVKYSGSYRDTIPVGIHREYDESSIVVASKMYDDFGNLIATGIMLNNGKKIGLWKNFYIDGSLKSEGEYSDGKKINKWIYYFKNGEIEQEGSFKNGRYDGVWNWYYDTGEIKRTENYYNGREDGICVEYSKQGDVIETGEYINGLKEGEWINSVGDHIEKGAYKEGLREGEWVYYFLNEKIKFEGSFIQGMEDGKHRWYYANGKLKEERYYVFGSKEKLWKIYDEEGIIFMTILHRNNKEVKINGKRIDNKDTELDNE